MPCCQVVGEGQNRDQRRHPQDDELLRAPRPRTIGRVYFSCHCGWEFVAQTREDDSVREGTYRLLILLENSVLSSAIGVARRELAIVIPRKQRAMGCNG